MSGIALLIPALAVAALAQTGAGTPASTSSSTVTVAAETTATLLLPPAANSNGFAGYVVDAGSCATTYGLTCTSGAPGTQAEAYCEQSSTYFVTYAPSSFMLSTSTLIGSGTHSTFIQGCSLDGSTKAVCSATYTVSADEKKKTTSSTTTTLTSPQIFLFQVPITAGAGKLSALGSSCTSSSSGAAAATGVGLEVRKVLVAQAAVAALAAVVA